jgi:hypothetical protein
MMMIIMLSSERLHQGHPGVSAETAMGSCRWASIKKYLTNGDLIFGKMALKKVCSLSALENEATELNLDKP